MRSTKSRPYQMKRRAELVDETRQRITDATIRLHTTIGPANTSIAAIADEAGVTRLTVYRHFPTLDELFVACRGHWRDEHRPPDISAWAAIPGLEERARRAFDELYGWYRDNSDDLYPNSRDFDAVPLSTQQTIRAERAAIAGALIGGHDQGASGRRLRAVAGHLVAYWTWRSLAVDEGLSNRDAVDLAVRFLTDAAGRTGVGDRFQPAKEDGMAQPGSGDVGELARSAVAEDGIESAVIFVVGPDSSGLALAAAAGVERPALERLIAAVRDPAHPIAKAITDDGPTFDVQPMNPGGPALRSHLPLAVVRDGQRVVVGVLAVAHESVLSADARAVLTGLADAAAASLG